MNNDYELVRKFYYDREGYWLKKVKIFALKKTARGGARSDPEEVCKIIDDMVEGDPHLDGIAVYYHEETDSHAFVKFYETFRPFAPNMGTGIDRLMQRLAKKGSKNPKKKN